MAESKYQFDDPKAAFAEAETRIQQVLKSGANELELRELGLTELPESLGQLIGLEHLDLVFNRLAMLPDFLARLTKLKKLVLAANQLTSLPDSLIIFEGERFDVMSVRRWREKV